MSDMRTSHSGVGSSQSSVLLSVAVVAWLVFSLGRGLAGAEDAGGSGAEQAGYVVGSMFATLAIAFVLRTVVRLVRRRPAFAPMISPGLFFTAAGLALVLLASTAGQSS